MGWARVWLRAWQRRPKASAADLGRIQGWIWTRFRLEPADEVGAIIQSVAQLVDAGVDHDEAVRTVLRILDGESRA